MNPVILSSQKVDTYVRMSAVLEDCNKDFTDTYCILFQVLPRNFFFFLTCSLLPI